MKVSSDNLQKNIHLIILSFLGLAIAVFAGYYFIAGSKFVPENFTAARQDSALVAKDIVSLAEESSGNLEKIAEADKKYRFNDALSMVRKESGRVKEAQQKAVELLGKLDIMTKSAAGVTPKKARDLAIGAIGNEISLIYSLFEYDNMLSGLLQTLEYKFSGDIRYDADDVQNLIKNMNIAANEINNLNNLFNEKMVQFDAVFK